MKRVRSDRPSCRCPCRPAVGGRVRLAPLESAGRTRVSWRAASLTRHWGNSNTPPTEPAYLADCSSGHLVLQALSINQSINPSFNQCTIQPNNQATNQPTTNQPTNKPTPNQPMNQPTDLDWLVVGPAGLMITVESGWRSSDDDDAPFSLVSGLLLRY